ncbi:MAG: acyl carrier protein [Actinomycetota bacterium]|nr:acyl carrier protein [Actinomycetota bacterium]
MDEAIQLRLTDIFQSVFDDPELRLTAAMTAKDVPEWDSLSHITLIVAIEREFRIRFTTAEVAGLMNVGDLADRIRKKLA